MKELVQVDWLCVVWYFTLVRVVLLFFSQDKNTEEFRLGLKNYGTHLYRTRSRQKVVFSWQVYQGLLSSPNNVLLQTSHRQSNYYHALRHSFRRHRGQTHRHLDYQNHYQITDHLSYLNQDCLHYILSYFYLDKVWMSTLAFYPSFKSLLQKVLMFQIWLVIQIQFPIHYRQRSKR